MDLSGLTGLINNIALLLALCLVYDMIDEKRRIQRVSVYHTLLTGIVIGGMGIAIMLNPWKFTSGIQFDTRSVILCISGLFLGTLPTAIAVGMTGAYRLYLGGPGAFAGVAVIVTSGGIGLFWRYFRKEKFSTASVKELYLMGMAVHGVMLLLMLSLPWPMALHVLSHITIPVLILFPATTAIIGWLMVRRRERRKTDQALSESGARFKFAMEANRDGLWDWDVETDEVYYSPGYSAILGYGPSEFPRHVQFWKELIHPDDKEMAFAINLECIDNQRDAFETEFRMQTKSGEYRWIMARGKAVKRRPDGKATRMVGTHTDITDRKLAENRLRDREAFLSTLLNAIPIPVFYKDRKGRYLGFNLAYERFFGETKETLIGKSVFDISPEEQARIYYAKDNELFERGGIQAYESQVKNTRGEMRDVIFNKSVFIDHTGAVAGLIGAILDITDRKQAEASLKWELALHEAVAGISKELISQRHDMKKITAVTLAYAQSLTQSAHGFIVTIDKTTLAAQGHADPESLDGACEVSDSKRDFFPDAEGRYGALWGHALDTRSPFFTNQPEAHPGFGNHPLGHLPIKNFLAAPVILSEKPWGMIALANSARDFSEKDIQSIERIKEVYALALFREAYENAKRSLEKQLQQIQRLEAIGTLAGGIAHDFNNILFPIIGFTEMMLDQAPEGSELRESLNEVLTASIRASELVKQILAFSRQSESEKKPTEMAMIVREALKLTRATLPSTITIHQTIAPDLGMVMADPTQLHQIVMNLMTNAFHAMEGDGGTLTVTLTQEELPLSTIQARHLNLHPGLFLCFSVADTGMGMEKKVLDRIFDPYFTTKPEGKGTGLGLSVVHGIIKSLKGDTHVTSEPGKGTLFTVYLPAIDSGAR